MTDLTSNNTANKVPSNQDDKIIWSTDLFAPVFTAQQIKESEPTFQDEAAKRRMMFYVLAKTPIELLEAGQKNPDTFTELLQVANDYLERMETALELATAAHARLCTTAGKLVADMNAGAK